MLFGILRTQRSREVEALAEPALEAPQQVRLLGALDAFGDDVEPERRSQPQVRRRGALDAFGDDVGPERRRKPQDRVDERRIPGTGAEPVDERLRDLQL